ncbi:MAG: hypothetical protein ABIH28_02285 [archaeon]
MHSLKLSKQKMMGTFLFLFGIFAMIYSGIKLTGFAVSQEGAGEFFFIGIVFVIVGIFLMSFSKHSQLEIKLYKKSNGKNGGKEEIYMTDPENLFGKNGTISLEQFRKDMKEIKKDPALLELIKEAYFVPLMDKYAGKDGSESELAEQYLIEIGFEQTKEDESRYALPKTEITRIKKAFSERRGKITSAQKRILTDYQLRYIPQGNRAIITPEQGGERIVIGICPGDINAGKRISSLILKLCDFQHRKKSKK